MAKKKGPAQKAEAKPPAGAGMTVVSVKMTKDFRDWMAAVAEADRITTVQLIEKAVVEYAEHRKHSTPAPRRTEGR